MRTTANTPTRTPRNSLWRCWPAAAPALIVTAPLIGFSLQGDERQRILEAAQQYGSNPFTTALAVYRDIGTFLDLGNFRPVGRFTEGIERSFTIEAAEATSLAPSVVQGLLRALAVAILAMVATRVVSALVRPPEGSAGPHPAVTLYPLIFATALVAGGPAGSLTKYSVRIVGWVILILILALAVARDRDMQPRRLSWHEPLSMALLGAAASATYDLVYVAPPLAAAFLLARNAAGGHPLKRVLRTAAIRRWAALSVGFGAAFAPVRLVIASRCSQSDCYVGSDIDLSGEVVGLTVGRVLTGAPPAGWHHISELLHDAELRTPPWPPIPPGLESEVIPRDMEFGLSDLAANSLLAVLLVAIVVVTVLSARRAAPMAAAMEASRAGWLRPAASLAGFGAAAAVLPSLLVSPSKWLRWWSPRIGQAWRESVLVQTGWSFMIAAAAVAVIGASSWRGQQTGTPRGARAPAQQPRRTRWIVGVALPAILGVGLALTLLANARMAHIDRSTPVSSLVNEISAATISIDRSERGNERRCSLIDAYTRIFPDPQWWQGGPNHRVALDEFMLERHGWPFCDPTRRGAQ